MIMSDHKNNNIANKALNNESVSNATIEINKTLLENIIGTSQSDHVPESVNTEDDHVTVEKTIEVDNSDQTNSKTSRELKLLLALSKEANLNTNISHKRTTSDGHKIKDTKINTSSTPDPEVKRIPKLSHDNRNCRYPVTAESELELELSESDKKSVGDSSTSSRTSKRKRESISEVSIGGATEELPKKNKKLPSPSDMAKFKENKDMFCWRCHREGVNIACETCPRSYHQKCLKQTIINTEHWPCPECVLILKAESTQTRSAAMKGMTLEHLCNLLKFAVNRMIQCQGSEPFLHPVSTSEFPDYEQYIVQPMDLTKIEKNIKDNLYGSTQAFEADAKWLLHNSIIFNSYQSKLTTAAKSIIKICKQEMAEIENCPSCYLNANTKKDTWFVEVCPKPHLLVWAKLKGFPFWPAKAMCTNSSGMVDVRFFGAHDRAWVHYKDCYLYSEKDPNTFKQKRYDIEKCVAELNIYIENLKKIYGEFEYAPFKTMLEPDNEMKQLQMLLPKFKTVLPKKRSFRNDFSNKDYLTNEKAVKNDTVEYPATINEKEISVEKGRTEEISTKPPSIQSLDKSEMNFLDVKINDADIDKCDSDVKSDGVPSTETAYSCNKFNDDSIMEGYGTDDDTNIVINSERKQHFIEKKTDNTSEKNETATEEYEEDDTQVPNNITVNNLHETDGDDQETLTDNGAILSKETSDPICNQKRPSTEIVVESLPKIARSDLNVKADSNLMTTISEKINRVDISENMEVTLGNDDIGCISISENISSSSDSEMSKSSSEYVKRKPIQVDIENAELTISPTNKLKISDKLMKRLSDGDENSNTNTKVEEVKKNIIEKKSPTDILIEKFKNVVDHEVVDFIDSGSSTMNDDGSNKDTIPTTVDNETTNDISTSQIDYEEICLQSEDIQVNMEVEINSETLNDCNIEEDGGIFDLPVEVNLQPLQTESVAAKCNEIKSAEESKNEGPPKLVASEKLPKKQKELIQTSITTFTVASANKLNISENCISKDANVDSNGNKSNTNHLKPIPQKEKSSQSEVRDIDEQVEDNEVQTLKKLEIDKSNIFNIIHSSLKKANSKETVESKETPLKSSTINEMNSTVNSSKIITRKRKINSIDTLSSQAKLVKLVPIESILNQSTNKEKESSDSPLLHKSLQGKKMIQKPSLSVSTPMSTSSGHSSVQEIITEDIKSEPESENEFSESENLEAKRQYLSALNILEKPTDSEKKQVNTIRTRSKTEEKRDRFKKIDNMTKIIDDVALNYSASTDRHDNVKNSQEGEIFVKSFAKMAPPYKPRARKTFPTPTYVKPNVQPKPNQISLLKRDLPVNTATPKKDFTKNSVSTTSPKITLSNAVSTTSQSQQTAECGSATVSHVIILPPNQTINYSSSLVNPLFSVVSPVTSTTMANSKAQPVITHSLLTTPITPNVVASQNYIPQSEQRNNSTITSSAILQNTMNHPVVSASEPAQSQSTRNNSQPTNASNENATNAPQEIEFSVLNSLLPETVSRAVSDLLLKPPPKLKPRPPGALSTVFDEGVPSSVGGITAKINSVAHRLGDYFRGMLIETLEDLGKSSTPEAKITSLQMEIESLKHRHNVEISEVRKNICTILKDIQKSIVEDRERIVDETRAACEAEAIKRVELAKSKQWCANCSKEAQFYCCWNTSYCDYPCQQKHWPQHVGKCTQSVEKTGNTATSSNRPPGQQLILRPAAPPKPGMGRIVAKPTKVYMNKTAGPLKTLKALSTTGNHFTVIETAPGNFELLGNGSITVSGKVLASNSGVFNQKFKPASVVTVTSPSSSGNLEQRNFYKIGNSTESPNSSTSVTNSFVTPIAHEGSK